MKNSQVVVISLIILVVIVLIFAAVAPALAPSQPTAVAQSVATETAPSNIDSSSTVSAGQPTASSDENTSPEGSNVSQHMETIHQLEEAFNQGNRDVIAELFSPDFVGHMPENDLFGSTFDINAMTDLVSILPASLPNLHVESDMLIGEGDLVAQRVLVNGDFEVEFFSYPPTGNPIAFTANVFYRFDDAGMIIEQWIEFDTRAVLPQFDAEAES